MASQTNLSTIAPDELAGVRGGATAAERARAHVGSAERCSYVKEHLGLLGTTQDDLGRVPRIDRNSPTFGQRDLKDRLLMENYFHCRTRNRFME